MSPPAVRVNTFVEEHKKQQVDPISKMFILMESILGLDRLPLMGKEKFIYVFATFIIFLIINGVMFYMNYPNIYLVMLAPITQNIVCSLLSYARCKWMQRFYSELNKFDANAGCTPKVSLAGIQNVVFGIFSCVATTILFIIPQVIGFLPGPVYFIPIYLVYVLEVYYFGHLLSLLIPRLKLINFYLESSLSSASTETSSMIKNYVYFKYYDPTIAQNSMKKLMDLFEIVVEAYDCLIEGIKWQLLSFVISAFISVLTFIYNFSLNTIRDGGEMRRSALYDLGVPIILLTPLFAPCMFSDSVHSEVRNLRELLASRLFENKLDKSGRSVARALFAFTETRDLSFRLLRILNIDIALPFKFMGLLVTYLIILLQFEKVLNP